MNFFPEDTGGHPRRSGVTLKAKRRGKFEPLIPQHEKVSP